MPRLFACGICLLACSTAAQTGTTSTAPQTLADHIAQIVSAPDVSRDHWGISVTSLDRQPIYALNEAQLFQPASNAKLYTTAAALYLLGPGQTFQTVITGKLSPRTHTVEGDLALVGGGDANLDSEDLPYVPPASRPKTPEGKPFPHQPNPMRDINDLVAQLAAKGVTRINGDIVGDDTVFAWEPYPQDWSIDDAVWGYGAPVSALTIQDNELRLEIDPGNAAGQPATVTLEQAVPYYTIQNETRTVIGKGAATGIQVERSIGSRTLRLYGSIALKDEADVEHVAIEDPAEYAAMTLRAALLDHGIAVAGRARARHRPVSDGTSFLAALHRPLDAEDLLASGGQASTDCLVGPRPDVLATHISAPVADDVVLTNKVSQNLHAELLLRALGRRVVCADGTTVSNGARFVRSFLIHAGIDPGDFIFYDGSGLSGHDLVTPRATARLLAYAATDPKRTPQDAPWFGTWKASLPIAGEDGSLLERFKAGPVKDHVFAKTGTLSEARALSGYIEAGSGRTLIFSIMVGNHLPGTSDRDAMDKIVAAIQASE